MGIKFLRYIGIALVFFSLTIGLMLDCNYFNSDQIQASVLTSFLSFLVGITFLCYADEKLKS